MDTNSPNFQTGLVYMIFWRLVLMRNYPYCDSCKLLCICASITQKPFCCPSSLIVRKKYTANLILGEQEINFK